MRIELSYIEDIKNSKDSEKIETGIRNFEKSLADGEHIEEEIFTELMDSLNIDINSIEKSNKEKLMADIDHIRSLYLQTKQRSKINREIKEKIKTSLRKAGILSPSLNRLNLKKIFERNERWIYRDYQSSIGDFMLKDTTGPRKFNIIGFADFIDKRNQWKGKYNNHIEAMDSLFMNLNIDEVSINDARPHQIRRMFKASVELLIILSDLSENFPISRSELTNLKVAIQNVV
ncbi:hypothetical protein [Leptospira meyeri]|uniref:hypothetical protein n=1 Tax=Leptospira meyeri TaxID=29508 RepID=UPI0002BFF46A|nr:hypothetical protein [Leptospira meyeri]EMJ89482.1 hypothetical protein LEP1GSC196_3992 [Leptospira meyeri serovar Semaranga str. Veldrot Semarang 173]